MKVLVFSVLALQALCLVAAKGVPVFIWGDTEHHSAPVFSSSAEQNLEGILSQDVSKVVFVESQLSSDDFNYCTTDGHSECFAFLGRQSAKFYSPNIDSPYQYMKDRVYEGPVQQVQDNEEFSVTPGQVTFVIFRPNSLPRQQRLAHQDEVMANIVARLGQKNIVYIYTGVENVEVLKSRVARQAKQDPPAIPLLVQHRNFVIALRQFNNSDGAEIALTGATAQITIGNTPTDPMELTITTTPAIKMTIMTVSGRWFVSQMEIGGKNYTSRIWLGANDGFSYSCTPPVNYIAVDNSFYTLTGLQLQVARTNGTDDMVFGEAFNCVGFTSAGIWGGLFVVIILLLILAIGLSWMMDINTMDRFDDPKGKTIIINAQE